MFLADTTAEEVSKIIDGIQTSKASGPNSIPPRLLKMAGALISHPLSLIINHSFSQACFPSCLKLAKVIPVYKSGATYLCSNYRPISLLSSVSKVFEKAMHSRLYTYLEKYNLIYELQFGFRQKHSTSHALVSMIEQIKSNLDTGKFAAGVFLDLQKAFDTVNHSILLKKLEHYGIRGRVNDWFASFLKDRKQFVTIDSTDSATNDVEYGVPQGSVLGPLLFLLYINDLRHCLTNSISRHFADDTNILLCHSSLKTIRKTLTKDVENLFDWLCANRLSLNTQKTDLVLFKPPSKLADFRLTISFGSTKIHMSNQVSYLGVLIDASLTWKPHITELSKKLTKVAAILSKVRHFVPLETLKTLYFSLFQSQLSYGCLVWGFANRSALKRLYRIQKRTLRIITFSDFHAPTSNLFEQTRILKLDDIIELNRYLFMYDWNNGQLPYCLRSLMSARTLPKNTRNSGLRKLHVPKTYTVKYGDRSLKFVGPNILNNLIDYGIDFISSKPQFKRQLHALLIAKY